MRKIGRVHEQSTFNETSTSKIGLDVANPKPLTEEDDLMQGLGLATPFDAQNFNKQHVNTYVAIHEYCQELTCGR